MDRPLRFCMITTFYPPYSFGGDAVFVHRLSNELARRGHVVDVIHCRDAYRALAGTDPAAGYDDHPGVTVHGLESPWGRLSALATQQTGFPSFKSVRIREILARNFDVIHYHNISLVGGPGVLALGRGLKLYTMHEYWLICPTHALFRFNRAACRRPYCFACTLMYRRPPQVWRYLGLLDTYTKHVDAFISPSRFTRDLHRRRGFDRPIVHIPLFVPPDEGAALTLESGPAPSPTRPYFLFVGRLERLKGLDTLIPIFRRYEKADLLVAGTGSDEGRLRRLAEGIGNVRFLGRLAARELAPLYRHAVALLVPSRCYESFALVVIEAFREQTPVIVRDLGALPETVRESGAGFTYTTEAELVARMDQLLGDPAGRRALGLRGHQVYLEKWTPEAHLSAYFALIEPLTVGRAGNRVGPAPRQEGTAVGAAMSRVDWYSRRTRETLRYEGLPILLWRSLSQCVSPVGAVQLWTFYRRDLTKPLVETRARADVTITLATDADTDELAALVARRYGPTRPGPYEKLGIGATILHRLRRGLKCFVARSGTEIVHYNWLAFQAEESLGDTGARITLREAEAYCSDAYTVETWRGKGIHTAVLHAMLDFLQKTGYRTAYTDVGTDNRSSWKTHERLGWEVCGTALDFRPRGGDTIWRWRMRGTLYPFIAASGTFVSLSTTEASESANR